MNFLAKNKIIAQKVKIIESKFKKFSHAYVTFKSDIERDKTIEILDGCKFRNNTIKCKKSNPLPDPLMIKRLEKNAPQIDETYDRLSSIEREEFINDQVCSLWRQSYKEQICNKIKVLESVWKKCHSELKFIAKAARFDLRQTLYWFRKYLTSDDVIPSPVLDGYRNKYEFNVGSDKQVGFRLGLYRQGSTRVVNPPSRCPIISKQASLILYHFQRYLTEKTKLQGYNPIDHSGYWKKILVRINRCDECLIMITITRQPDMTTNILDEECRKLVEHFSEAIFRIQSIYLEIAERSQSNESKNEIKHLSGESYIFEKMRLSNDEDWLRFRISPMSFFQINTEAAEILYKNVKELAQCDSKSIILDICCGTGAIGLFLANHVDRVLGFELNEEAIEDAKSNAQINNISNIEFHCGRVEKIMGPIIDRIVINDEQTKFVAILDPPRSGLPSAIIKKIRNCRRINRLIYIACQAMAAKQNLIDLCRPTSKAYNNEPFMPVKAIPVDMFPHTERLELIL
ncbi:tRNA (uracil-5-)-methyltransferase-like protein, partial [Sarcoptes scabiei]